MVRRQHEGGELQQQGEQGTIGQRGGEGSHCYRMQQNLAAFGDDYWIENALGSRVFFVDGESVPFTGAPGF